MCKALTVLEKRTSSGFWEVKQGWMVKRTENNCYQACPHWFLGELGCQRSRLEI